MSDIAVSRSIEIEERLKQALPVLHLEIIDESHLHKGHEGAKSGASHFAITVVSSAFHDLSLIARHRCIYTALKEMIPTAIHALKINALTEKEHQQII